MPEYWFRYGVTEVSAEIPEETQVVRLGAEASGKELELGEVERLAGELAQDVGESGTVALIYDHSPGPGAEVLQALVAELEAQGVERDRIILLTSSWRLSKTVAERELERLAKPLALRPTYPWEGAMEELRGLKAFKKLLNARVRVAVASAYPHGLLGFPGLGEGVLLGGWLEWSGFLEDLEETWERVAGELGLLGLCSAGAKVYAGDAVEAGEEAKRAAEEVYRVKLDEPLQILLLDAGGWPWDSTLESSLHVVGLGLAAVEEGGLIGVMAECVEGLGEAGLTQAFSLPGEGLWTELTRLFAKVRAERKVAFTSTLPKSILASLLNSRGYDSPQDLLTYGFRLFGRGARVGIMGEWVKALLEAGGGRR